MTSSDASFDAAAARPPSDWRFPRPFGARAVALTIAALALLSFTGARLDMGRMAVSSIDGVLYAAGLKSESEVASGFKKIATSIFPIVIEERTPVGRIEGFDRAHLPLFAHVETVETKTQTLNPLTLREETVTEREEVLVEPVGYLIRVAAKMAETLEIALWGTVLAVVASLPLAVLGARNFTPHRSVHAAVRGLVSLFRSLPELVSALFLVLAYGFGPIAGVLALAIHGVGFLGKFYADDLENADPKPQEALRAIGASPLKVLRFAVWPQVAPQYVAYTLYVLDRNVRMATVIGLVGAGGIGQELKGRYDIYNYGHVGTILVAIFILVFALDQLSTRLRRLWL
jgi:phosphonate transport system permease protein